MVDTDTGNLFIVGSFNKRTDPDFKVSIFFKLLDIEFSYKIRNDQYIINPIDRLKQTGFLADCEVCCF